MGLFSILALKGARVGRFLLTHEPQIEKVVGIGLYAYSIYGTYCATRKQMVLNAEYEEKKKEIEENVEAQTEEGYKKNKADNCRRYILKTAANWSRVVLPFAGGTACWLRSNHILVKRSLISAAAADAWKKKYEKLNQNVQAVVGEEQANRIKEGKAKVKNGKHEQIINLPGGDTTKQYVDLFVTQESNAKYRIAEHRGEMDYNHYLFIELNQRLKMRRKAIGHVGLNEVIKEVGEINWLKQKVDVYNPATKRKERLANSVAHCMDGSLLRSSGGSFDDNDDIVVILDEDKYDEDDFDKPSRIDGFWIRVFYEDNIFDKIQAYEDLKSASNRKELALA